MHSWERRRWGTSAGTSRTIDPQFRDAPSTEFLKDVSRLIKAHDYAVVNLDATVVLEAPRIAAYVPRNEGSDRRGPGPGHGPGLRQGNHPTRGWEPWEEERDAPPTRSP